MEVLLEGAVLIRNETTEGGCKNVSMENTDTEESVYSIAGGEI